MANYMRIRFLKHEKFQFIDKFHHIKKETLLPFTEKLCEIFLLVNCVFFLSNFTYLVLWVLLS